MPTPSLQQVTALKTLLQYDLQMNYVKMMGALDNIWPSLCMDRTTKTRQINEAMFSDIAALRIQAEGQPVPYITTTENVATIFTKPYKGGCIIPEADFEAHSEVLMEWATSMAEMAAYIPRDGICDALQNGNSTSFPMYDGQNYFSNAHPKAGSTFSNLTTGALTGANFQAVRTLMRRVPSDDPRYPLPLKPNLLFTPPELEVVASEIIFNTLKPDSGFYTENVLKGLANLYIDSLLTDPNDWYVGADMGVIKPFLWVMHEKLSPVRLVVKMSPEDENVYNDDVYLFNAKTRERIYPSRPELMIKSVN